MLGKSKEKEFQCKKLKRPGHWQNSGCVNGIFSTFICLSIFFIFYFF